MRIRRAPWFLWQKQAEFRQSNALIRGFVGGRGAGKSVVGAVDIAQRAKNGESWMAVSPSYPVLEESTWPVVQDIYQRCGIWVRSTKSPMHKVYFRTHDGGKAELVFRTGEKPESLRGPSKAGMWLDEAGSMHEDVFKLGMPTLRNRGKMGLCIMTFTPKGRRHWTYGVFYERGEDGIDRPKPGTFLVQARTKDNPFLPPEFYGTMRGLMTSALADQELEGQFVDLAGLIFRRDWFGRPVDRVPKIGQRVRYWDKAATEDDPRAAYTVGLLLCRTPDGMYYVEDVIRRQVSYFEREQLILETARSDALRYNNEVIIVTEQEPGSGGKESALRTIRNLAGFPVYKDVVGGGRAYRTVGAEKLPGQAKIIRAQPVAAQAEAGNVRLKLAEWNQEFLDEVCAFPLYATADQVDALSGAFNWLAKLTGPDGNHYVPSREANPIASERHGVPLDSDDDRFDREGWFRR